MKRQMESIQAFKRDYRMAYGVQNMGLKLTEGWM